MQPTPPVPPQPQARSGRQPEMQPAAQSLAAGYVGAGKLRGQVAIVTGGDSGIGRATCVLFAREGASVALSYLPAAQSDADETATMVAGEGQRCLLLPGDLLDPAYCDRVVRDTVRHFGRLDVLVNNAAYQEYRESIGEIDDRQWDRSFRTNVYAYFYLARAAMGYLGRGAAIVNVGSVTGLEGSEHLLDYASTKGAIHAFTKSLAKNLAAKGIRVNAVAPGPVWTPLNVAAGLAGGVSHFGDEPPAGRPAQPEEIAPAIVFLASAIDSSYVTGEVLSLLGGRTTAA